MSKYTRLAAKLPNYPRYHAQDCARKGVGAFMPDEIDERIPCSCGASDKRRALVEELRRADAREKDGSWFYVQRARAAHKLAHDESASDSNE